MGSDVSVREYDDEWKALDEFLIDEHAALNRDEFDVLTLGTQIKHSTFFHIAMEGEDEPTRIVGIVSLERGRRESDKHTASLRIHLRPEHRGRGTGSRLLAQALDWADAHGIERITATPYITRRNHVDRPHWVFDGDSGRKVQFFAQHGFRTEGTMRKAARLLSGEYTDVLLMARVR